MSQDDRKYIIFLHGLESGPQGSKVRYLRKKYKYTIVPDMEMSLWRINQKNSVINSVFEELWNQPVNIFNWYDLTYNSVQRSLDRCHNVARKAVQEMSPTFPASHRYLIGSSWGGAVALSILSANMWSGNLILLAPAYKRVLLYCGWSEEKILAHYLELKYIFIQSKVNILVIHGDKDDVVPLSDSQQFCEVVRAKLIIAPDDDHPLNKFLLNKDQLSNLIESM